MEHSYIQGAEVDYESNIRKEPSSSAEVASQVPQGTQLIIDLEAIDTPDDPECEKWYPAQWEMSTDVFVRGYICARLVHTT